MDEFVLPDFLQGNSYEEILQRLIDRLPADIDVSEGSDHYNDLAAVAWELSLADNFILPETIKTIFPQFSYGYDQIADYHAESHGLTRKPAVKAKGVLRLSGTAGKVVYSGSVFSTMAVNGQEAIQFITTEDVILNAVGVSVNVEAQSGGTKGNVAVNTIVLAVTLAEGNNAAAISDLALITNPAALTGGTDTETTKALLDRLLENEQTKKYSFCGSISDYKRWALEVTGVGACTVISAVDDSGTVTLVLLDSAGNPATPALCLEVYNHIMHPENPDLRLTPTNALLVVQAPSLCYLAVNAAIELEVGTALAAVKAAFLVALKEYLSTVATDIKTEQEIPEIKYSKVSAILANTAGVYDFSGLTMGGFNLTNWALVPEWLSDTDYQAGDRVYANAKVFICSQSGTSGSTAPNGTGTGIANGTAEWDYLKPLGTPPLWALNTAYTVNALVEFNSSYYICLNAHTSDSGIANIPLARTALGISALNLLNFREVV